MFSFSHLETKNFRPRFGRDAIMLNVFDILDFASRYDTRLPRLATRVLDRIIESFSRLETCKAEDGKVPSPTDHYSKERLV